MPIVPSRRDWTRQPQGTIEIDPRWRVAVAAVPRQGAMLEAVSKRIIAPAGTPGYVASDIGHAITGAAYFDIPTPLFKINKGWSLLFVLKNKNSNTGSVQNAIWNPGYNSGNGDILSVGLPDYTSFARLSVSNVGNYAGANGVKTVNPAMDMNRWSTFLWSHPAASAGTIHTPKGATAIAAATPFGGASDIMRLRAAHTTFEVALVALIEDVLPGSAYPLLAANPWQIFRPRRRIAYFNLSAAGGSLNAQASGAGQASGAAQLAAQVALAGIGIATADGSAVATVAVPLAASGIAVADGNAGAQATVTISAAGLAQAAASAGVAASVLMAGAAAAEAAGNAALAAQLSALAGGSAQAGGNASLSAVIDSPLAAAGLAQASASAILQVSIQLQASGGAAASGSASGLITGQGAMAAAGAALASGIAAPTLRINLAASGQANATGGAAANLNAADQITAIGSAQAGGSAALSVTATLTAAGFIAAMGAGVLAVEIPLSAFGQAQASGTANISDVPDYIPVGPLRLTAAVERPVRLAGSTTRPLRLRAAADRPITLRHEVTRAHQ